MVAIECKVGTAYQYSSIRKFGFKVTKSLNGQCRFRELFETGEQAKARLTETAKAYFENPSELDKALDDITKGFLTIDAATAYIVEVPEEC